MPRKISSDWTPFYKNSWLGSFVLAGVFLVVTRMDSTGIAVSLLCILVGTLISLSLFADLRTVEVDADFMYIKDGKTKVAVLLRMIKSVRQEWRLSNPDVIVVSFKTTTKFGDEIRFVPYTVFRWFFQQHPLVKELKHLANLPVNSL